MKIKADVVLTRQRKTTIYWMLTGSDGDAPSFSSHSANSCALAGTSRGAKVTAAMFWWMSCAAVGVAQFRLSRVRSESCQ